MTSSLVGSEMCIRDSRARCLKASLLLRASVRGMSPAVQADPPFLCPVSYTHLTLPTICSV
eukprot:5702691-Prorocentrum_lima.AAC.1